MKKILFAVLSGMILVLSGCAGMMDKSQVTVTDLPDGTRTTITTNVDNSPAYGDQQAYGRHIEAEGKRLASQTKDIMKPCENCPPGERAWSQAFKIMALGYGDNFKVARFELEKSKTWTDVASEAIKPLTNLGKVSVISSAAVSFADKMLDKAGSTNIQMGEGGTIDGSFNEQSYESNASTLYGDAEINTEVSNVESVGGSSEADEMSEEDELYCTGDSQCEEGFVCDEPIFTCVKKDY